MALIELHRDAAPAGVGALLKSLSTTLSATDFYLAGGTALALLEGHRMSVDLDVFSPSFENPEELLALVEKAYPKAVTTHMSPRTLYVRISETIVSFFGYSYPLISPLLRPEPELLPFASRDDIAAMKLAAIASRGSRKDFIDLWWLVDNYWPLGDCLGFFREKFEMRDVGHVVKSLVFFDDADREPPLRLLADIDWTHVKDDFRRWTNDLVHSG